MSNNTYTFISNLSAEIKEITDDTIVSKPILNNEDVKVVLFGMAIGQELSEHTVATPAMLHFLTGETELTLNDDTTLALPNSWAYLPPNMPHSLKAVTPVTMLLVMLKKGNS